MLPTLGQHSAMRRMCTLFIPLSVGGFTNRCFKYCHRGLQYRAEYWNPKNLGYQFLAEAKRLFEIESVAERPLELPNDPAWEQKSIEWETRRLVLIQAGLLLNLIDAFNGFDKIGWRYTLRSFEMANEIQLFRKPRNDVGRDLRCVRDFTAWAFFVWQRCVAMITT